MGRTFDQSVGDWTIIPGPKAPEGAPNVLLILIDDAGFGAPDTFGGGDLDAESDAGRADGPDLQPLPRDRGVLADPGGDAHRAATTIASGWARSPSFPGPYPGYTGVRPRSCTPLPRILRENGYVTAGFGKWHLTPGSQMGASGPMDHWPLGWGFDHWYGFLTGAAGQYDPLITVDNTTIGVPEGKDGELVLLPRRLHRQGDRVAARGRGRRMPQKPWMMYYSTGCAHAPHHVAKEWADRYKGKFNQGWDVYREETLARQKKLGIVPEDTELSARPDLFPAWDSLSDAEKKLYARQMEVVAGYQENADWNVGRLLDAIERAGELDNTLIIYIWGDNGASMEGTLTGSFNETTFFNGVVLDADEQLEDHREEVRWHRGARRLPHRPPLRGGLGPRQQHAVPVGQADGQPPRRNARPDGGRLAEPDQGGRGPARAVHALHRHRPDRARARRHRRAEGGRRDRAGADGRHQLRLHARRGGRRGAAHGAVLRDARQPGDVQGRLVGLCQAGQAPVGLHAGDDAEVRPGCVRPGRRRLGALLPARRLLAVDRTWPRSSRTSSRSSRSCSGRRRRGTVRFRFSVRFRSSWAICRRCRRSPASPSPATCRTCRPR